MIPTAFCRKTVKNCTGYALFYCYIFLIILCSCLFFSSSQLTSLTVSWPWLPVRRVSLIWLKWITVRPEIHQYTTLALVFPLDRTCMFLTGVTVLSAGSASTLSVHPISEGRAAAPLKANDKVSSHITLNHKEKITRTLVFDPKGTVFKKSTTKPLV